MSKTKQEIRYQLAITHNWFMHERLRAYESAIRRVRWLLLITTLLSSLILTKVYLEKWGFQEHQLNTIYLHRAQSGMIGPNDKIAQEYDSLFNSLSESLKDSSTSSASNDRKQILDMLKQLSLERYVYEATNNTLKDTRIKDQTIPLLGTTIPGNDYVPILAIMLAVFSLAVWLNIRSIWVAVWDMLEVENNENETSHPENDSKQIEAGNKLREERIQFIRIVKLHFTFTGAFDKNIDSPFGQGIATGLEMSAYWLPFLALLFGSWFDLAPIINQSQFHVGPSEAIAIRVIILFVTILVTALSGLSATSMSRRVDFRIKKFMNMSS